MTLDAHPAAELPRTLEAGGVEPSGNLTAATNAPSGTGSLVASFGSLEGEKLLVGAFEQALVGRELYLDARHHQHYVTRLTRNPHCRFDHETWTPSEVGAVTLGEALGLGPAAPVASELGVEGDAFAGELTCSRCGRRRALWKLRKRLVPEDRVCLSCGKALVLSGYYLVERLSAEQLAPEVLGRPLRDFGLRPGDVFSIWAQGGGTHYQLALEAPVAAGSGVNAVVAGCGNIGSHLVPHLARIPGVGRVVLVDPDAYEPKNLAGQDIRARDVTRSKVEVQAERLREIRPELDVVAVADRLENLPLAHFRNAIVFGALDSRLARKQLNQAAWRAGSPWIDMAVDGPGLLCRVSVYSPGLDSPCIECGWDAADYETLRQNLPCEKNPATQDREEE
jgi:hypothetical protein